MSESEDLFLVLLKLKSYLISLIDDVSTGDENLAYTEEYLDRKYPGLKEEVIGLLTANQIFSDSQIVFDEKIHLRFRDIIEVSHAHVNLKDLLEKYNIQNVDESLHEKTVDHLKSAREQKLKEVVSILLQLARIWSHRNIIENKIDDFSLLEEENLIRPDEELLLYKLDDDTNVSFGLISKLTKIYLEHLVEYYFHFGGNVSLANFINELERFKKIVEKKYIDLFNKHGLNPNELGPK